MNENKIIVPEKKIITNPSLADRAVAFISSLKHTKGEWHGKNFDLLPWQDKIIRDVFGTVKENGYRQYNTAYIEIPKKQGKQLALDTPIPTPTGWSTMAELKVGDIVFDENGTQCRVVAKSAVDDTEQAYRLTFRDGHSIIAGANHLWDVDYFIGKTKHKIMRTEDIYQKAEKHKRTATGSNKRRSVIRIRIAKPIQTAEATLPINPYLYGYWFGNGCGTEKAIRPEYLRASENQRWELLQGLMDSDGSISNIKSQSIYVSTVKQLAEGVSELLWSLGIKNAMTESPSLRYGKPTGETLYQIRFTTFEGQPTAKLKRKAERKRARVKETRSCFHYLETIEPVNEKTEMQCIQVDSKSHCYLAGKSMVPTHNSELAAAVALYLLAGDGEWGAEVYGCAADRQQASIVFDVACQMVEQCPALKKRIKPVLSQKRLVYTPLNSFYQVLSAESYTKHGLNVHGVVFDELHAQPNRALFDVMTHGSGDARKQPLFFLITTAGTDRNSICWEQHQKAKDIMAGKRHDDTFYPVIYGIEENDDWTDEKIWYKANPSLGVTVDIEKLRAAFVNAKENPAEENLFRQLRLNDWVKQSIRWMPMEAWDKCDKPVVPDDLLGRECYAGLDLSSSTDITAFVLVFPPKDENDVYYILPYFWVPEETLDLRVRRDHVPYDTWKAQGSIMTTEGNVIHYGFIEKFIEELGKKYNIKEIAYDRWGAVQMSQNLEDAGFTIVPFGQGFKDMSPATKELMKLVLEGRIAHGGNAPLRWMMDNIYVRTDPAENIKPDKEKSTERIDGAVATIMALDRAIRCAGIDTESVYDNRGILLI